MKTPLLTSLGFFLFLAFNSIAQEDCATALTIPISGSVAGDNTGAMPDIDYSLTTSCAPTLYNSAQWYTFTTTNAMGSAILTFTAGSIVNPTLTIIDDCSSSVSFTYQWFECQAGLISGSPQTICDLVPNTVYYIQISSASGDEGSFTIAVDPDLSAPTNDVCELSEVLFGGVLDCQEFAFPAGASASGCPDNGSTGACFPPGTPGVWYTFDVPADMPYGAFTINPISAEFEIYSSNSGCNNLAYVDCGGGFLFFSPTPGTTYYILAISTLNIGAGWIVENATCTNPLTMLDTGNGTGESDLENNSCEPPDYSLPCQNEHVIWYSYTVGCQDADIVIEVDPWLIAGPDGVADDAGITAMLSDCSTLMAAYDPVNGTGYVCSALAGNQDLVLSGLPAGTTFLIAVGSGLTFSGYYEIIVNETPVAGGGLVNDDCPTPIVLNQGPNVNLHNNCSTQDLLYPTCTSQSEATVWYLYDPGTNLEDITIHLMSTGIANPAIAVYDDCSGSSLLGEICGSVLSLDCIDAPIYIQIGSTDVNSGGFDLDITTTIVPPPLAPIMTATDICSNAPSNVEITLPGGMTGDITVTVSSNSSSQIVGMMSHTFVGVNSATISDVLINCATTAQNAVYSVEATITGSSCPSSPQEISFTVFPKLIETPLSIEECLPFNVTLDAANIISGGTAPYISYTWLWNGTTVISVSDMLTNYPIGQTGTITLQVTDAANCSIESVINITAHPMLNTLLLSDAVEACQGDPQVITLSVSASTGGPISLNDWSIYDDANNLVTIGTPLGNDYTIVTDDLDPGTYTASVISLDVNGCTATSNDVVFDIFASADGAIEVVPGPMCSTQLVIQFYGPGGMDIYNNGPDSNGDGIPDNLDADNDGLPDIATIMWTTPTMGVFNTGEFTFTATENGVHSVEIVTDQNCIFVFSVDVTLTVQNPPTIITNSELCLGNPIVLESDPSDYVTYSWFNENGDLIAVDESTIEVLPTSSPATYTLETTDANGCIYTITSDIILNPSPTIQLSGSTSICPGETTIVNAGGDPTLWAYQWFDVNNVLLGSDSSSLIIDAAGDYTVVVANEFNCVDTFSFTIDENAELAIDIVGDDLCGNETNTLDGGPGFDSYEWLNQMGDNVGNAQTIDVNSPGIYYLNVALGMCTGMDSIEIIQAFPPVIDLIQSIDLCNNAGAQSAIDFTDLVMTSDPGQWTSLDLPSTILDDLTDVDFDMVSMGSYQFVFTTNVAVLPCVDISDTLTINVSDCPCLNPDVNEQLDICITMDQFDLDDQLTPSTDSGNWSFGSGPSNLAINGTIVNITNALPGSYVFVYTLDPLPNAGCQESDVLMVEVVEAPQASFDNPPSLCNVPSMMAGSTLDLNDVLIMGSGTWVDPNITNLDFSDPSDLSFIGVAPGNYMIEFVTDNAISPCQNQSYFIDLTVIDCNCPFIDLQTPDDLCNDNGFLDLTSYEGISDIGTWSADPFNPQTVVVTNGQIDLTGMTSGTYFFIFTLDNVQVGCPEFDVISFQLFDQPQINNATDAEACNDNSTGGTTMVDLNELVDGDEGIWTDAGGVVVQDPSNVDFSGLGIGNQFNYTYTTTNASVPCDNVSTDITVTVIDCSCNDPEFLDPPVLCNSAGQSIDLEALILSDHEGEWKIIDQPDGANSVLDQNIFVVEYVVAGDYVLEFSLLEDPGPNCASVFTFTVTIINQALAVVDASGTICTTDFNGDNTILNLDQHVLPTSSPGSWVDANGDLVANPNGIDFLDAEEGMYVYTYVVENEFPCTESQSTLTVMAEACSREVIDTHIYIPNIFSPNGDNLNDIFFIQSDIDDLIIHDLFVFDRWGERVFRLSNFPVNDPSYGWNGQFKGQDVVAGVYQYLVEAVNVEGKDIKIVGDVTVVQ